MGSSRHRLEREMVAGQAPGMQRRRQVVNQTLNEEIRQQTTLGLNNGQRA